jgi:hypothetical protein
MAPQLKVSPGPTKALAASPDEGETEEARLASADITWEVAAPPNPRNLFMEKVLNANDSSRSCQKAKSIIKKDGFSDIETRVCRGKVYHFLAMRDGKQFSIAFSAITGNVIETKAVPASPEAVSAAPTSPEAP